MAPAQVYNSKAKFCSFRPNEVRTILARMVRIGKVPDAALEIGTIAGELIDAKLV
jgi:hypothetical protein